jgi:hypothetical protein
MGAGKNATETRANAVSASNKVQLPERMIRSASTVIFFLMCLSASAQDSIRVPEMKVPEPESVVTLPDSQPEFPGGRDALLKFILENLKYPQNQDEIQGKVYLSFSGRRWRTYRYKSGKGCGHSA